MKNPIIGITLDEETNHSYSKYPWYAARKNYSDSIDLAGGISIFFLIILKILKNILDLLMA